MLVIMFARRVLRVLSTIKTPQGLNLAIRTGLWNRFLNLPSKVIELETSMSEGPRLVRESVIGRPQTSQSHNLFSGSDLQHQSPVRWVYRLRDCALDTQFGAAIWRGQLIGESTPWPGLQIAVDMNLHSRKKHFDKPLRIGLATVFPSNTYYHFLIEDVPALLATLESFPDATIATPTRKSSYVRELLAGLKQTNVTCEVALAENAVFAGKQGICGFPQAGDVARLRSYFLNREQLLETPSTQITHAYISRRLSRRPVPNEDQIEQLAITFGFEVLFLEMMSLDEQIAVFRNLSSVVGYHGAGLSNLAFASPGVRVFEVLSSDYVNHCFEQLTAIIGGEYSRYLVEGVGLEDFYEAFQAAFSAAGQGGQVKTHD